MKIHATGKASSLPTTLTLSPDPGDAIRPADFDQSNENVKAGLKAWLTTERFQGADKEKLWGEGQPQIKIIRSRLKVANDSVTATMGISGSSKRRVNHALKLRPLFTDPDGNYWSIQVVHPRASKGLCQLIWEPYVPSDDEQARIDSGPLITHRDEIKVFDSAAMRCKVHENANLRTTPIPVHDQSLDAAVRARLLSFDAAQIETGQTESLDSAFQDETYQDAAMTTLCARMTKWPYCYRVLVREKDAKTIGYVSAGPLHPTLQAPSSQFIAQAHNFTWSDLCWNKPKYAEPEPEDDKPGIVLCFSGFRIHPEIVGVEGVAEKLLEAVRGVYNDFVGEEWPVSSVVLCLHQPAANMVFRGHVGGYGLDYFGERCVRLTGEKLKQLGSSSGDASVS